MTPKYTVKKTEDCAACKGSGYVQHPAWKAYWEAFPPPNSMTAEQDRAWFDANGWDNPNYTQTNGLPDEEIPCAECEGEGEIVTESDLRQALGEINQAEALSPVLLDMAFALAAMQLDARRADLFDKSEAVISAREALDRELRTAVLSNKFDGKNAEIRDAQAHDQLRVQYADLASAERDERRARYELEAARSALDLLRYRLRIQELAKQTVSATLEEIQ